MPNPESTLDEKSVDPSSIGSIRVDKLGPVPGQRPSCDQYTVYPGQDTRRQAPEHPILRQYVPIPAWHGMSFEASPSNASGLYSGRKRDPSTFLRLCKAPLNAEGNTITSVLPETGCTNAFTSEGDIDTTITQQRQISAPPGSRFTLRAYPPGKQPPNPEESESLFPPTVHGDSLWIQKSNGVTLEPLYNEKRFITRKVEEKA